MPKAVSNIDTEFFEDVTALTLWIDEAVQGLAAALDNPALLDHLVVIHRHNRAIGARSLTSETKSEAPGRTGLPGAQLSSANRSSK